MAWCDALTRWWYNLWRIRPHGVTMKGETKMSDFTALLRTGEDWAVSTVKRAFAGGATGVLADDLNNVAAGCNAAAAELNAAGIPELAVDATKVGATLTALANTGITLDVPGVLNVGAVIATALGDPGLAAILTKIAGIVGAL